MASIQEKALKLYKEQCEAAQRAAEQAEKLRNEAAMALKRAEEEARIRLQEERELARLRAERALAEEKAREEAEAEERAVQAELKRLFNRTPLEKLQDEMAELKREFEGYKQANPPVLRLCTKQDGSLDMRYKSSKLLSIVANNHNLGIDPHYGHGKTLQVSYSLEGSETQTKEVDEHQTLEISGPGLMVYNAIWFTKRDITKCRAGVCNGWSHHHPPHKQADVTKAVIAFLKEL